MKSIVLLLGLCLIVGTIFCPIGCQYALHEGPDWLVTRTSVPNFTARRGEPAFMASDSAAVKTTTVLLMVLGAVLGLVCIATSTESDSSRKSGQS